MLTPLRLSLLLALGGCAGSDPCHGGASTPILLASGAKSGFERCDDGTIHRATAETVDPTIPLPSCVGDEEVMSCTTDADCTAGEHGKCVSGETSDYYAYESHTACGCSYACASDAECDAGYACVPAEATTEGSYAECKPATCAADAECASGACGVSDFANGCGQDVRLVCRDPATDTCTTDADCTDDDPCAAEAGVWECSPQSCVIGRPLTTPTGPRTAPPRLRADWADALEPTVESLDPAIRRELARHWRAVGGLEHASVASFARFTLQLLALGAPPELVADTQLAAADEVRHARLTYGLASAYAGAPIGPGPMELGDTSPAFGLEAVTRALIAEACVGETFGVTEALYAAADCEDPVVAELLREIAADESRHAALAWRTLRWLLSLDPTLPVAAWVDEALAAVPIDDDAPSRRAHGVLGGADRRAAHAAAVAEVIRPTLAHLLNSDTIPGSC